MRHGPNSNPELALFRFVGNGDLDLHLADNLAFNRAGEPIGVLYEDNRYGGKILPQSARADDAAGAVTATSAQTLDFAPLTDRARVLPAFDLSATASSGLAVIFESSTPAVCAVSGSTVTTLRVGRCSITATQAGGDDFLPASVTRSFEVTAALAAGGGHSLEIRADGTLHGWGANASGQLGDGSTMTRPTPVPVSLPFRSTLTSSAKAVTSWNLWLIISTVRSPATVMARTSPSTSCASPGVSTEVGSSSTKKLRPR